MPVTLDDQEIQEISIHLGRVMALYTSESDYERTQQVVKLLDRLHDSDEGWKYVVNKIDRTNVSDEKKTSTIEKETG
jgi:hypothetical protein